MNRRIKTKTLIYYKVAIGFKTFASLIVDGKVIDSQLVFIGALPYDYGMVNN